jgi:hypothetical protein
MSAGNATHVVQKLITSYFFAAPTLPSVAELSSDSEIGLYKGGVRVSHISEIPASRIGKKHAYFSLGSSTLEMCVEHTKWEKCELNLGGAVEPSLIIDSLWSPIVSLSPLKSKDSALLGEFSTSRRGPRKFFNSSTTYSASLVCTTSVLRNGVYFQVTFNGELKKKKAEARWDHAARTKCKGIQTSTARKPAASPSRGCQASPILT